LPADFHRVMTVTGSATGVSDLYLTQSIWPVSNGCIWRLFNRSSYLFYAALFNISFILFNIE